MDRDLMRVLAGVMVGVGFVAALAACGDNGVRNEGAVGSLPPPQAPEPTSVIVTLPAVPGPAVNVWRAAGLTDALDALQHAAGGQLLLTRLVLYPTYAIAEARNPRRPADVDRYVFRAGVVAAPSPVVIVGTRDLDAETFTRDDVAFAQVPALVRSAPAQLGIEGARATHVIVERDTVFAAGQVVIRVYAGTVRRSGYVEYGARAKLRKVVE